VKSGVAAFQSSSAWAPRNSARSAVAANSIRFIFPIRRSSLPSGADPEGDRNCPWGIYDLRLQPTVRDNCARRTVCRCEELETFTSHRRRAWRWMRTTGCLAGAGLLLALSTLPAGAQQQPPPQPQQQPPPRAVNPAVNKVSEKKIDAPPEPLRCAAAYPAGHDDRRRPLLRRHRVVDREPRRDERPSRTAAGEDGRRRMEGGRIIQRARVDRE
jgi:hypothetical protein